MENFKMKVNVGNASIELEGDGSLVFKIFSELRDNGLGKLTSKMMEPELEEKKEIKEKKEMKESNNSSNDNSDNNDSEQDFELPELSDFVIKGNPSTEVEWLLIYALYQSESGSKLFTKENLREKYRETNRYTKTRNKNFAVNFKSLISNDFISAVNADNYKINPTGIQKANDILFKKNPEDKKRAKRQGKSFTSDEFKIVDVGLEEKEREAFRNYYDGFKSLSNMDKAIVISYWLKDNKQIDEIDKDIMFTMLRTAKSSTSFDIKGALANAKIKNSYYTSGSEKGKFKIHHIGEDYVKKLLEIKE